MAKCAFLIKRGNIYWFRRRPPVLRLLGNGPFTDQRATASSERQHTARRHLALSLRTSCAREARRRAARVAALFEFGWSRFEAAMNKAAHVDGGPDFQQAFARQMLDYMQQNVELVRQLTNAALPDAALAVELDRNDARTRRAIAQAVPVPAKHAAPTEEDDSPFDDPEFEAALLKMADDQGWWHTDPAEIVADFDWMLVGLATMQEQYIRYCVRKGLDPATALPSLSRLAAGLDATTRAVGVAPANAVPPAEFPPFWQSAWRPRLRVRRLRSSRRPRSASSEAAILICDAKATR